MIDIRKNRLNEIEIEVSKNSTIHNWLSDQAYFRRNDCWQHLFYETENTFIYCVSRKLFKEFVSWAFQGEQVHDCAVTTQVTCLHELTFENNICNNCGG